MEIIIYIAHMFVWTNSIVYSLAFIGKLKGKEPISTSFLYILAINITAVIVMYGGLK